MPQRPEGGAIRLTHARTIYYWKRPTGGVLYGKMMSIPAVLVRAACLSTLCCIDVASDTILSKYLCCFVCFVWSCFFFKKNSTLTFFFYFLDDMMI